MNKDDMKKVFLLALVFTVLSMGVILYRSVTRQVPDDGGNAFEAVSEGNGVYPLAIDTEIPEDSKNCLVIPLPGDVEADRVRYEGRYYEHELFIYIESGDQDFYKKNGVHTDLDLIEDAVFAQVSSQGLLCLEFKLDGIYEEETSVLEGNRLSVQFSRPSDKYRHVVVIDPAAGGGDPGAKGNGLLEKDVTLDTALLIKELSESRGDEDIKIYFTRLTDKGIDETKRALFVDDIGAQLFVELGANESADAGINGVESCYNDRFFVRNMTNARLAFLVEKNVAGMSGASAIGVRAAAEDKGSFTGVKVPASKIYLGYLTGNKDGERLKEDMYKKRLAAGIYEAVKEAVKELE